jgi:hypothetical protein
VDAPAIGDVFRFVLFPSFDLEQYRADPSRFFVVGVNMTRTILQAVAPSILNQTVLAASSLETPFPERGRSFFKM